VGSIRTRQTTKRTVKKTGKTRRPAPRRMGRPESIDEYLAGVSADQRRALGKLRTQIKAAAPRATESISYGIPTFKLNGKPLIYFAAWANHCSLYGFPMEAVPANYVTSKGTMRFPVDKPLPTALVAKLIKASIAKVEKGAKY
jgi:uncharacterized protein YdhG (YjbR/CyaY superfamily)